MGNYAKMTSSLWYSILVKNECLLVGSVAWLAMSVACMHAQYIQYTLDPGIYCVRNECLSPKQLSLCVYLLSEVHRNDVFHLEPTLNLKKWVNYHFVLLKSTSNASQNSVAKLVASNRSKNKRKMLHGRGSCNCRGVPDMARGLEKEPTRTSLWGDERQVPRTHQRKRVTVHRLAYMVA